MKQKIVIIDRRNIIEDNINRDDIVKIRVSLDKIVATLLNNLIILDYYDRLEKPHRYSILYSLCNELINNEIKESDILRAIKIKINSVINENIIYKFIPDNLDLRRASFKIPKVNEIYNQLDMNIAQNNPIAISIKMLYLCRDGATISQIEEILPKVDINILDNEKFNAFIYACGYSRQPNFDLFTLLLENFINLQNIGQDNVNPLIAAAHGGNSAIIGLLLELKFNPNYQDINGNSALHIIVSNIDNKSNANNINNKQSILYLLDKGADIFLENNSGKSVMRIARERDLSYIVDILRTKIKEEGRYDISKRPVSIDKSCISSNSFSNIEADNSLSSKEEKKGDYSSFQSDDNWQKRTKKRNIRCSIM